jgi:hypothetical protein
VLGVPPSLTTMAAAYGTGTGLLGGRGRAVIAGLGEGGGKTGRSDGVATGESVTTGERGA